MNPLELIVKFIPPTWLVAIAGVFAALAAIFFFLYIDKVEDYARFESGVIAEQNALAAEAERRRLKSEQETRDSAQGWASAVEYWRSRAGGSIAVRVPTCDQGGVRAVPGPTPGTGQASAEPEARTVVDASQCEALLNNAVRDAAQVEHLRNAWHAQVRASKK